MCATVTRHEIALEHAKAALISLQEEVFGVVLSPDSAPVDADKYDILSVVFLFVCF